jgi:transposase-like protein
MRRVLALREKRGLSFRELAEHTGVARGTLGYWAWKLRQEDGAERRVRGRGFVELVSEGEAKASPREADAPGRIEIVLAGDRRVVVSGDVAEEALERVLRVLQRC